MANPSVSPETPRMPTPDSLTVSVPADSSPVPDSVAYWR